MLQRWSVVVHSVSRHLEFLAYHIQEVSFKGKRKNADFCQYIGVLSWSGYD